MKRIIMYTLPSPDVINKIGSLLFPKEIANKIVAYMPSEGSDTAMNIKYTPYWQDICSNHGVKEFNFIDNSKDWDESAEERLKLSKSNILIITGGNTYTLLHNIRKSGLDKEIIKFSEKEEFVISGFSAGAAILTPTINVVTYPWSYGHDENRVGLTNLDGLGLIDFEVLPHYTEADEEKLIQYKDESRYEVRTISDSEYIVVEL